MPGGRRKPEPVPDSDYTLEADAVIVAFGFRPDPPAWFDEFDIATHANGRVRAAAIGPYPFRNQPRNASTRKTGLPRRKRPLG